MKNLKTFESFSNKSIYEKKNENSGKGVVGKVRKFFKGHESKEAFEKDKAKFEKELKKIEDKVKKNEDKYSFDKKHLEKQAKENNYLGKLAERKGGAKRNKDTIYVVYDNKLTDFKKTAKAAADTKR